MKMRKIGFHSGLIASLTIFCSLYSMKELPEEHKMTIALHYYKSDNSIHIDLTGKKEQVELFDILCEYEDISLLQNKLKKAEEVGCGASKLMPVNFRWYNEIAKKKEVNLGGVSSLVFFMHVVGLRRSYDDPGLLKNNIEFNELNEYEKEVFSILRSKLNEVSDKEYWSVFNSAKNSLGK